jgi:predicted Zn-dependent protease
MNFFKVISTASLISMLSLMLSGCFGSFNGPAPVEFRGDQPARVYPSRQTELKVKPLDRPKENVIASAQPKRAVEVLVRRADDQKRDGDLMGASASLERGLRIAPNEPVLWNRLAAVRLDQKRFSQVEQLAKKSNDLNPSSRLRADNWDLIANAREALGDKRGAKAARSKATTIQ